MVFGKDGNLYVTDKATNEVLRYDGSNGKFLGIFAKTRGDNFYPINLIFGPDGNLYVLARLSAVTAEVQRFNGVQLRFLQGSCAFFEEKTVLFGD